MDSTNKKWKLFHDLITADMEVVSTYSRLKFFFLLFFLQKHLFFLQIQIN